MIELHNPHLPVSVLFSLKPFNSQAATIIIQGALIAFSYLHEYLMVFLDHCITWNTQISSLCTKCAAVMCVLQALSGTSWGGNLVIQSMLYKSVIPKKMDYGAFLFGRATWTHLHKVDVVQNQAHRLILRAIKSTVIAAMESEAYLTQKYCTRIAS